MVHSPTKKMITLLAVLLARLFDHLAFGLLAISFAFAMRRGGNNSWATSTARQVGISRK